MPTTDGRLTSWSYQGPAGVTQSLEFTSPQALTSLSLYTGGTVTDVDDLTGATAHVGVLSGGNLVATVPLVIPTGGSTPLRLVIDGTVQTVGKLIPSTNGTASSDTDITISLEDVAVELTILGAVAGGGDDNQTAAQVPFTPTGTIAATDVQSALAEVSGDVTAEAVLRTAADTALSDLISTEQTVRADADTALDGRLDTIEADYLVAADIASAVTSDDVSTIVVFATQAEYDAITPVADTLYVVLEEA